MRKILLVDDDTMVRKSLRELIEYRFQDVTVVMAGSGEDGWREYQESQPDLVVTDFNMPRGTGGELAEKIRGATPVILLTGNPNVQTPYVDVVFSKPPNTEKFLSTIRSLLERGPA